jgi:hypothetical protein
MAKVMRAMVMGNGLATQCNKNGQGNESNGSEQLLTNSKSTARMAQVMRAMVIGNGLATQCDKNGQGNESNGSE